MIKILSTWLLNDPKGNGLQMFKNLPLIEKGPFNNHVDKILIIFDPLPPSRGQFYLIRLMK